MCLSKDAAFTPFLLTTFSASQDRLAGMVSMAC